MAYLKCSCSGLFLHYPHSKLHPENNTTKLCKDLNQFRYLIPLLKQMNWYLFVEQVILLNMCEKTLCVTQHWCIHCVKNMLLHALIQFNLDYVHDHLYVCYLSSLSHYKVYMCVHMSVCILWSEINFLQVYYFLVWCSIACYKSILWHGQCLNLLRFPIHLYKYALILFSLSDK